jgi:RimJ/RimL family protein N-acetyltransferase
MRASFMGELRHKGHGLFGIRIVRAKRWMKDGKLILRLRRLRDLPVLQSMLTPAILRETSGIEPVAFGSLFSFWFWLRTTFQAVFVMEVEERGRRRIVGFAGIYGMKMGQSLWLSLAVFDPKDRRQGYGKQTIGLLLESFKTQGVARTIFAEVSRKNIPSLHFFRNLGFRIFERHKDRLFLHKDEGEEALSSLSLDPTDGCRRIGVIQIHSSWKRIAEQTKAFYPELIRGRPGVDRVRILGIIKNPANIR